MKISKNFSLKYATSVIVLPLISVNFFKFFEHYIQIQQLKKLFELKNDSRGELYKFFRGYSPLWHFLGACGSESDLKNEFSDLSKINRGSGCEVMSLST